MDKKNNDIKKLLNILQKKNMQVQKIFFDEYSQKGLIVAPLDNMDGIFLYDKIGNVIPFSPNENFKLYNQIAQEQNLIYDHNELDDLVHSSKEYGKGYYTKIDDYYRNGDARYFYTKEAWDAYQRELSSKKNDNQKLSNSTLDFIQQQKMKKQTYDNNAKAASHEGDRWTKKETPKQMTSDEREKMYRELAEKGRQHNEELEREKQKEKIKNSLANRDAEIKNSQDISKNLIKQTEANLEEADKLSQQLNVKLFLNYHNTTRPGGKEYIMDEDTFDEINEALSDLRELEQKDENGIPLQVNKMSTADNMKYINYGRLTGDYDYHNNCAVCAVNMDLRERGYDVTAPAYDKYGKDEDGNRPYGSDSWLKNIYKDIEITPGYKYAGKSKEDFIKDISSEPEGSYGWLDISWKTGGAHAVFYKIENGQAVIYDGQVCQRSDNISSYLDSCLDYRYSRTDNLEVDLDYLKRNGYIVYD